MSRFEIKMPKLGESITEGTIISWSVKVGDTVQEDDVLFEVNTAKVSAEIPSPVEGKVIGILFKEGDTVPVGTVVAITFLAKFISCVTITIVICSIASSLITFRISAVSSGSSADVGSSKNRISGCSASALAIDTRCCCPPDN